MESPIKKIYLIRHAETEWSLSGQHTGRTDIPLTPKGEQDAVSIKKRLEGHSFTKVLCSPLQRALKTCQIAGFEKVLQTDEDLMEWDYGNYEGLTSLQILKQTPHWSIFLNGAQGGESVSDVSTRADRVLSKILPIQGDVALFSHGHFLRVLAARWLRLPPQEGRLFALSPASISILGFEKTKHVLTLWNLCTRQKMTHSTNAFLC